MTSTVNNVIELSYRQAIMSDRRYIIDLAKREIGINPGRLHLHKTFIISDKTGRIGFISYCRMPRNIIYFYLLAFEKEAQNRGLGREAIRFVLRQEGRKKPVVGMVVKINKTNHAALHSAKDKNKFVVIKELPNYYVLFRVNTYKPDAGGTEEQ